MSFLLQTGIYSLMLWHFDGQIGIIKMASNLSHTKIIKYPKRKSKHRKITTINSTIHNKSTDLKHLSPHFNFKVNMFSTHLRNMILNSWIQTGLLALTSFVRVIVTFTKVSSFNLEVYSTTSSGSRFGR